MTYQVQKIVTQPSNDNCIITVAFEREITEDEREIMRDSYKNGTIPTDPDEDLQGALVNQLCIELQGAYDDTGISGHFLIEKLDMNVEFKQPKRIVNLIEESPELTPAKAIRIGDTRNAFRKFRTAIDELEQSIINTISERK